MKSHKTYHILMILLTLFFGSELQAQFGSGGNGYGRNAYGRRSGVVPQSQSQPEPPKPKTADEIVDEEMPAITEALELNDFEVAVVSSILRKYVQERIELQILQLSPEKIQEGYRKIGERQDEELRNSLPEDKYDAFVEMRNRGVQETKRLKKKEKRKKRRKKGQDDI